MIYFLRNEQTKLVKIGFSRNVYQRIANLRHLAKAELSLIGLVDGGFKEERLMHKRFSRCHVRGEWFAEHPDMRELGIIKIPEGDNMPVLSIRMTPSMQADIESLALQDERKPADWVRLVLGAAIRARKSKGKRG